MSRTVTSNLSELEDMGSELVSFAIIERGFTNLTTGANAVFSMDVAVESNYVFQPKLWDAFARSLDSPDQNESMS